MIPQRSGSWTPRFSFSSPVPTYRVYYAAREPKDSAFRADAARAYRGVSSDYFAETEWEEEVEARNSEEALEAFFGEHIKDRSEVMLVDEDGEARPLEGLEEYDWERTYIWMEDGKLMEYQGLDEATPGKVTCPLCEGAGEVDEEVAEEFLEEYGEDEGGVDADVQG